MNKKHVFLDKLKNVNLSSERASKNPSEDQFYSLILTPSS